MENDLTTTDKVQELQKKLYQKAKSNAKFRFYALYDKVYRMDVLMKAWSRVKANKGAAGIDKETIEGIEERGIEEYIKGIQVELRGKSYQPQPARRVYIPKADGGKRPLSIPVVKDRIVQTALKLIIEPIFEAEFEDCSYGYRPQRSGQQAAGEICKYLNYGYKEVIETDIEDCFGAIPHRELLEMAAKRIVDGKILWLIKLFLKAGVKEEGKIRKGDKGTAQGGVISPLLANIYLNNIDKGWRQYNNVAKLIRYADDLVIMTRSKSEMYKTRLEHIVKGMKLRLKEEKTRIVDTGKQSFDFLGYTFIRAASRKSGKVTTYYYPSHKAENVIRERIRQITNWRRPIKVAQLVRELEPVIRGWVNYFRVANSSRKFGKIKYYTAQSVRKFMRKRRQKAGYGYKKYTDNLLYEKIGLYNDYRVCWMKAL